MASKTSVSITPRFVDQREARILTEDRIKVGWQRVQLRSMGRHDELVPGGSGYAPRSGSSSTMRRAMLNAIRDCRSLTPATIETCAPSGSSTSAHTPKAAVSEDLPFPLGIATTAVLIPGARTFRTIAFCHERSRNRRLAPFPDGTVKPSMNRIALAALVEPS